MRIRAVSVAVLLATQVVGSASGAPLEEAPQCFGNEPTIVGTPGDDEIRGTPEPDVIAGFGGDDVLLGGDGDDVLCGGTGDDDIFGGPGDDGLVADAGRDRVYGEAGRDFLTEVTESGGSLLGGPEMTDESKDLLSGGDDIDWITPEGGDDVVIGGSGLDIVDMLWVFGPVEVDLNKGFASSQNGGTDELRSIEGVMGGFYNDRLLGDDSSNWMAGLQGSDIVDAGGGSDLLWAGIDGAILNGGADQATDTVAVALSEPALIDLAEGSVSSMKFADPHPPDRVITVENAVGTSNNDILLGDAFDNGLYGSGGDDWVHGGPGDDLLRGDGPIRLPFLPEWRTGGGGDRLDGGPGTDHIDGGPKKDECVNGETVTSCESEQRSSNDVRSIGGLAFPGAGSSPWWWLRVRELSFHPDQFV